MSEPSREPTKNLHASFLRGSINVDALDLEAELQIDLDDTVGDSDQLAEENAEFSFRRRSSLSNINLGVVDSTECSSPDILAAAVAQQVKLQFQEKLPEELLEGYQTRDVLGRFAPKEIVLGRKLGSGEFSHVYSVRYFSLGTKNEYSLNEDECGTRACLKRLEQTESGKSRYALKHLRPEYLKKHDVEDYVQAARDLAMEAELLSSLNHPHIIKLRGTSLEGPRGFEEGAKGYFLIIDQLTETLGTRIRKWKKIRKRGLVPSVKNSKTIRSVVKRDGFNYDEGDDQITEEQYNVALQIAAAMKYLHSKKVIFRDLKPENIGFDVRGDVKIFDFGLACVMPANGDPNEDKYDMSGAGSPRYMAPEVLVENPIYNLKADVYTFGIVLWEMFSLQLPYSNIQNRHALVDYVVKKGERPQIDPNWPGPIQESLTMSFEADTEIRPTMELFYNILRFQLFAARGGDDSKLRNSFINRRRSTHQLGTIAEDGQSSLTNRKSVPQRIRSKLKKFKRNLSSDD